MIEIASTNFMKVSGAALNASVQTTSFNSDAFAVGGGRGYAVSAVFSGTTTGTLRLQASNDPPETATTGTPGNFVDIPGATFDLAAGSPFLWNVVDNFYNFVRMVHVDTGGGNLTITVRITTKG